MQRNDVFPSKWLKATDVESEPTFTIKTVVLEEVGTDGERKPVVYFNEDERGAVLNKTRWSALEYICKSAESDDWVGKRVQAYAVMVPFQGTMKPSISFRVPAKPQAPARTAPPSGKPAHQIVTEQRPGYRLQTTAPAPVPADDPMSEEIPF